MLGLLLLELDQVYSNLLIPFGSQHLQEMRNTYVSVLLIHFLLCYYFGNIREEKKKKKYFHIFPNICCEANLLGM